MFKRLAGRPPGLQTLFPFFLAAAVLASPGAAALQPQPPPGDDISQGLWWLYHVQYGKARECFGRQAAAHPEDPAGYFYLAATDWWHLAQDFDVPMPDVEKRFYDMARKTVKVAEAYAKSAKDPKGKAHAYFYWGGAEGLRGRWLVTQKHWVKAYFAGKNGEHFLRLAVRYDPSLYDAYLGLGIYDYYADTLPGVVGALSALLIRGDRARGLQELRLAVEKGNRARVEAMIFLIEIYTSGERAAAKALPVARQLKSEFPHSPAMHLAEIMVLYHMQDWETMMREAEVFLNRSAREVPYYNEQGIRPALYCLGVGELWGRHNPEAAFRYMEQILNGGIDSSRWVSFALLRRGQIYDMRGERRKAVADYRAVLARPDLWDNHGEARRYLHKPFGR